jgi:uncharacterized protein (TIGR03435 family)
VAPKEGTPVNRSWGLLIVAAIALDGGLQTAAPQSFVVASVKEVTEAAISGSTASPVRSGGRIAWTTSRIPLLRYAFRLQDWQMAGLKPSDAHYAIDARIDESATDDQIRAMLRTLLAHRFGLAVHKETRESSGFWLAIGKNGAKIKPAAPEDAPAAMPEWFRGTPAAATEGKILRTKEGEDQLGMAGRRVTMAQLADALQETLGAFVTDKTGLPGVYYFAMQFAVDSSPIDTDAPSLFTAVQEQLGLKLEPHKGPVEMLIIDHIEKTPTAN